MRIAHGGFVGLLILGALGAFAGFDSQEADPAGVPALGGGTAATDVHSTNSNPLHGSTTLPPSTATLQAQQLDALARILLKESRISEDWLRQHGFWGNLSAMLSLEQMLNGRHNASPSNKQLMRMVSNPESVSLGGTEVTTFSVDERYVHAAVPLGSVNAGDSIIVRWRNLSDESVQELSTQSIAPNGDARSVPVWMHRPEGWPVGQYALEVYAGNTGLQLLAASKFEFVPSGTPTTPQAYPVHATDTSNR